MHAKSRQHTDWHELRFNQKKQLSISCRFDDLLSFVFRSLVILSIINFQHYNIVGFGFKNLRFPQIGL